MMAKTTTLSTNSAGASNPNAKNKPKFKYQPLNIDKYMPLGTVGFKPTDSTNAPSSEAAEIDGKPSTYLPAHNTLGKHLDVLYLNGWIRVLVLQVVGSVMAAMRVYLLPDDVGRGAIPREDKKVRAALKAVMAIIDSSADRWNGLDVSDSLALSRYESVCTEQDSLFYIFNTLQSPLPDPLAVKGAYASMAMRDILDDSREYLGLKTQLFDYQKRSAATMIQREAQPVLQLDSRLEVLCGPTGKHLYFDRIAGHVLSEKRCYEQTRGGILAETMGHGKTLITLAVILATKGNLPQVPLEYQTELQPQPVNQTGDGAASLKSMICRSIYQHAVPWKSYFNDLMKRGEYPESCQKFIQQNPSWYSIAQPQRNRRSSYKSPDEKKIFLSSTTIVVVPQNLMPHWQQQIATHLEADALSILVMENDNEPLPAAEEILKVDLILMSKQRYEDEMSPNIPVYFNKPGKSDEHDDISTYPCLCSKKRRACPLHTYRSPLLDVHFLRFVVDEGHNFASSSTRATIGLKSTNAERKWIISGTPSKGLLGMEIDMATDAAAEGKEKSEHQREVLERRKARSSLEEECADLAALGQAVTNFLGLQPWANSKAHEDSASWQSYLAPDAMGNRKAGSLRCVLDSLVVRHQMSQIEKDIELPPLHSKVVYLEPSYFDKTSLNLFALNLTVNAITSEREDQDYMFHPKNKPRLEQTINNLRQSGFHWVGFEEPDIRTTVKICQQYLDESGDKMSKEDFELLKEAMQMGQMALETKHWERYASTKELGLYVAQFPSKYRKLWTLRGADVVKTSVPMMTGATFLLDAQRKVDSNLYAQDPLADLEREVGPNPSLENSAPIKLVASSIPSSYKDTTTSTTLTTGDTMVPKTSFQAVKGLTATQFNQYRNRDRSRETHTKTNFLNSPKENGTQGLESIMKSTDEREPPLPEKYTKIRKAQLVGTSCAKLSYLIDRVVELHREEKILIFYEGDHIAYFVGQILELLQINHEIYANGLKVDLRSKYLEDFNKVESVRVLLMDLKQAAHGLHIASASRVFFINPVWSPSIEAQAIKRAHRIGQTKPVYVETLVLKDTLEDKMLQRRKAMTNSEHQKASRSPVDDTTMNDILKNADFHKVNLYEARHVTTQYAPLKLPQQLFGREFLGRDPEPESESESESESEAEANSSANSKTSSSTPETVTKKRKAEFEGEAEDVRPPKSPRLKAPVLEEDTTVIPEANVPPAEISTKKRKPVFADDVDDIRTSKAPTTMSNEFITPNAEPPKKKRKLVFADEVDELQTSKVPATTSNEPTTTPAQSSTKKRKAVFADEVDEYRTSKVQRMDRSPSSLLDSDRTDFHTPAKKPTIPDKDAQNERNERRALFEQAQRLTKQVEQALARYYDAADAPPAASLAGPSSSDQQVLAGNPDASGTLSTANFPEIYSTAPTSGGSTEDGPSKAAGTSMPSKKRKAHDEEHDSSPKRRFTV